MFVNTNLKKLVIPAISAELLRLEKAAENYKISDIYQQKFQKYASFEDKMAAKEIACTIVRMGHFVNVLRYASIHTDAQLWGAKVEQIYLDLVKCEARLSGTPNALNQAGMMLAEIRQKQCQELVQLFDQLRLNIIDAGYTYQPEIWA